MSSLIALHKQIKVWSAKGKQALQCSLQSYLCAAISPIRLRILWHSVSHHSPFFPVRAAWGYVWPDWPLHSPLVVFVVLISMPIIYESATGYGRMGSTGWIGGLCKLNWRQQVRKFEYSQALVWCLYTGWWFVCFLKEFSRRGRQEKYKSCHSSVTRLVPVS